MNKSVIARQSHQGSHSLKIYGCILYIIDSSLCPAAVLHLLMQIIPLSIIATFLIKQAKRYLCNQTRTWAFGIWSVCLLSHDCDPLPIVMKFWIDLVQGRSDVCLRVFLFSYRFKMVSVSRVIFRRRVRSNVLRLVHR